MLSLTGFWNCAEGNYYKDVFPTGKKALPLHGYGVKETSEVYRVNATGSGG